MTPQPDTRRETDNIRLDLFASVYERSDDKEWRERAAAVRRLRRRVAQAEAALRRIAHFKFDVMRSPALDLHDVKAIADEALSAGDNQ